MIQNALSSITKDLDNFIKGKFSVQESKVVLNGLVDNSGQFPIENQDKLVVTFTSLRQEAFSTNYSPARRQERLNAPVNLGVNVLISACFNQYEESLRYLSLVFNFFQGKPLFTSANTPGLNPAFENITIEALDLNQSELNALWARIGTHYRPSLYYKIRMISTREEIMLERIPAITGASIKISNK